MSLLQFVLLSVGAMAALCALMAGAWRVQQVSGNSGWVDVFWTFSVGGVACMAALAPFGQDPWPSTRQLVVASMVAAWSLRLGFHIAARARSSVDDPRYRQLAVEWGADASRRMFWFLQSQAVVGAILVVSVGLAAQNPHPALRIQDAVGIVLLLAALVGESVSDRQLRDFKANSIDRNAVCDVGLWGRSRHPNYFFEWLSWVAYPVIAIDWSGANPLGWLALLAPACMYWVLVHVSGIPPLESHMVRTRGEAFRSYQRRTRSFLPFPLMRPGP